MNAPANIPQPLRMEESDLECAHRKAISIHLPNQGEMEMAARVEIAMIRDQATRGAARAGDSAALLLQEVSRLATFAVYAPMPVSKLLRVRSALNLTMEAARSLERVTRG